MKKILIILTILFFSSVTTGVVFADGKPIVVPSVECVVEGIDTFFKSKYAEVEILEYGRTIKPEPNKSNTLLIEITVCIKNNIEDFVYVRIYQKIWGCEISKIMSVEDVVKKYPRMTGLISSDGFRVTPPVKKAMLQSIYNIGYRVNKSQLEIIEIKHFIHYTSNIVFIPVVMKNKSKVIEGDIFMVVFHTQEKWKVKGAFSRKLLIKEYPDARDKLIAAGYFPQ